MAEFRGQGCKLQASHTCDQEFDFLLVHFSILENLLQPLQHSEIQRVVAPSFVKSTVHLGTHERHPPSGHMDHPPGLQGIPLKTSCLCQPLACLLMEATCLSKKTVVRGVNLILYP